MRGDICAVVLAAGEGRRLRPLTVLTPKALCPVANEPLLDRALARVSALGCADVAVNAAYLAERVIAHVGGRAHVSHEKDGPLGTSGGVGRLRDWIAGRPVLVANADAYLAGAPVALVDGWDGHSVRLLGVRGGQPEFGPYRFAGMSLLPWRYVKNLSDDPAELVTTVWRPAERAGELAVIEYPGTFIDTGTPGDYLRANLHAAGFANLVDPSAKIVGGCERSVVGAGAVVRGAVADSVVWPGGSVAEGERLRGVVRAGADLTVAAAEGPGVRAWRDGLA